MVRAEAALVDLVAVIVHHDGFVQKLIHDLFFDDRSDLADGALAPLGEFL